MKNKNKMKRLPRHTVAVFKEKYWYLIAVQM